METHWAIFTAITLGAGVQWHQAYDAVDQIGRWLAGVLMADPSVQLVVGLRRGARFAVAYLWSWYGYDYCASYVLTRVQVSTMQLRSQW